MWRDHCRKAFLRGLLFSLILHIPTRAPANASAPQERSPASENQAAGAEQGSASSGKPSSAPSQRTPGGTPEGPPSEEVLEEKPAGDKDQSASADSSASPAKRREPPADGETAGDEAQPGRAKPGTRVLLPGGQAWNPPKAPPAAAAPQSGASTEPSGAPEALPQPAEQARAEQTRQEGVIYWTGRLQKNETIVIEGSEASAGRAEGDLMPGRPVDVYVFSPAIAVVGRPEARNGWKRVAFRCLRSTQGSVTLNIQWRLRP